MNPSKSISRVNDRVVYHGVAAADIANDSIDLTVICPELTPNATSGDLGPGITNTPIQVKDRDGNPINQTIVSKNHIVATWDGESNSRVPPLIRAGEPVEIYRKADQDKFYWRPTGKGRDFRKTDRVHIEVGATDPNKPSQEKNDDNTYSAYLDSERKLIGVKSSNANGEATRFIMEADLNNGTFYISDQSSSPGNRIFLDTGGKSGTPAFQVNLATGVVIRFQDEDGYIKVPKKLLISAGERIVFDSPITVFNLKQAGAFIINAASIAINSSKETVITASLIGLNAVSTKLSGVLAAASAKITNLVKASVSGRYNEVRISNPVETPVNNPSNSADTDLTGPPYQSL